MKWFKHDVDAERGKIVAHIVRKYGLEGEARYWRLVGLLAWSFPPDKKGYFTLSLESIQGKLRQRSVKDCILFLECLASHTPIIGQSKDKDFPFFFEHDGNNCRIRYDKISEIKDNYTKDLQATSKRLASNLPLDKNKRKNKRKREDSPPTPQGVPPTSGSQKPNPVIVAAEIADLLRRHPPGTDLNPMASIEARIVFSKFTRAILGSATEFEFHQYIREALKASA